MRNLAGKNTSIEQELHDHFDISLEQRIKILLWLQWGLRTGKRNNRVLYLFAFEYHFLYFPIISAAQGRLFSGKPAWKSKTGAQCAKEIQYDGPQTVRVAYEGL